VLMGRVGAECPGALVRAYADDAALVFLDYWLEAPRLQCIFEDFGSISGLYLNLQRCIAIPLGAGTAEDFQARRAPRLPGWSNVPIADCGKHLGFCVGPGKGEHYWEAPGKKCDQRWRDWGGQGIGLQYRAVAYNFVAVSQYLRWDTLGSWKKSQL
ncbi:unnamed protein product, partial [Prorocentrum cordatum]